MRWKIEGSENVFVVMHESSNIVTGSISRSAGSKIWIVEILWSGPDGDIMFEAKSFEEAVAFTKGVQTTFDAMESTFP